MEYIKKLKPVFQCNSVKICLPCVLERSVNPVINGVEAKRRSRISGPNGICFYFYSIGVESRRVIPPGW